MDQERDILGLIRDIIHQETRWHKHYLSQVKDNQDTINKGRVLVVIPELGFDNPDQGVWAYPRQGYTLNIPKLDDWVEVYFMVGDPNRPVYIPLASEMMNMLPTKYTGDIKDRVIFESPETGEYILYNDEEKRLDINITGELNIIGATKINLLGATEAFVNGTTFDSWITGTLKSLYDAHTHTGVTAGGAASGPPAVPLTAPSNHLSTKIKGE